MGGRPSQRVQPLRVQLGAVSEHTGKWGIRPIVRAASPSRVRPRGGGGAGADLALVDGIPLMSAGLIMMAKERSAANRSAGDGSIVVASCRVLVAVPMETKQLIPMWISSRQLAVSSFHLERAYLYWASSMGDKNNKSKTTATNNNDDQDDDDDSKNKNNHDNNDNHDDSHGKDNK